MKGGSGRHGRRGGGRREPGAVEAVGQEPAAEACGGSGSHG
jgi:hypothetical protein